MFIIIKGRRNKNLPNTSLTTNVQRPSRFTNQEIDLLQRHYAVAPGAGAAPARRGGTSTLRTQRHGGSR